MSTCATSLLRTLKELCLNLNLCYFSEYIDEIYNINIQYNYRVAARDEHIMIATNNCDCVGPVCENCIRHFFRVPESGDKVEKDDPKKISQGKNKELRTLWYHR
jgi:hypothetical protein